MGISKNQQVSAYFESLVLRHAVLYLLKPERDVFEFKGERKVDQLQSIKIKSKRKKEKRLVILNNEEKSKKEKLLEQKQIHVFEGMFPGQKVYRRYGTKVEDGSFN